MALSNSSLSGCFDCTFPRGFALKSWFFLCLGCFSLAWVVTPDSTSDASANAAKLLDNRFIPPQWRQGEGCRNLRILKNLLTSGFASRSQQGACIALGMPGAEIRIPSHQELRSCLDDRGDRVVSHPAVHLDFKCQPQFLAQLDQPADLVQREGNKALTAE